MKELIKKILKEEETSDDNTVSANEYMDWATWEKMSDEEQEGNAPPKGSHTLSKDLFFKIIKNLVNSHTHNWFEATSQDDSESISEKLMEPLTQVFKLFGQDTKTLGWLEADSMWMKAFYAANDNYSKILNGEITKFDELYLRPLKSYQVECHEDVRESSSYDWIVKIDGYSSGDVKGQVIENDDGYYSWWEWEGKEGFSKENYDSDSDGMEVYDVSETSTVSENKIINEGSGSDLVSGLKKILRKWKESRTENRWYDEIEDLIKKEKLNENKEIIEQSIPAPDTKAGKLPAIDVLDDNEWAFITKLVDDGLNNYSNDIDKIATYGNTYETNEVEALAKIFGVDDKGETPRLQMIMKYILNTVGTTGENPTDTLSKLKNGELFEWGEYLVTGFMFETTWVKSSVEAYVPGFGPDHAAYNFTEDIWSYDPEVVEDDSYRIHEAENETQEVVVTAAEDLKTGKEYTGHVSWEKGYSASGNLHESLGRLDEITTFRSVDGNQTNVQPIHLKLMGKIYDEWNIDELINLNPDVLKSKLYPLLKLFGVEKGGQFVKRLVQFMVDNPNDYTEESSIGKPLPPVIRFAFSKTWIEEERVSKEGDIEIWDTNYQSAVCEAKNNFWDYDIDTYDSDILDTDFIGEDEWASVQVNGKEVWNDNKGGVNYDGSIRKVENQQGEGDYNPYQFGCEN